MSRFATRLGISTQWGISLLAGGALVLGLYFGRLLFIPLVSAILLASITYPIVVWLNKYLRLSVPFAALAVVTGLIAINVLLSVQMTISIAKIVSSLDLRNPDKQTQIYAQVRDRVSLIYPLQANDQLFPSDSDNSIVFKYLQSTFSDRSTWAQGLWYLAEYMNSWMWFGVLVIFILLFLLAEGRMLGQRVTELVGASGVTQAQAKEVLTATAIAVRKYIVWRTIVNVVMGIGLAAAYHWLFDLKFAWTWGLLTIVAWYVPYLGPLFAGFPPFIDAFMASPTPWYALGLLIFYTTVITIEGYVIVPVVMGRRVELNATTVMLACLFWELVWGLPGLFLAVPLMAALKAICENVPGWEPWANLMSTQEHQVQIEKPAA